MSSSPNTSLAVVVWVPLWNPGLLTGAPSSTNSGVARQLKAHVDPMPALIYLVEADDDEIPELISDEEGLKGAISCVMIMSVDASFVLHDTPAVAASYQQPAADLQKGERYAFVDMLFQHPALKASIDIDAICMAKCSCVCHKPCFEGEEDREKVPVETAGVNERNQKLPTGRRRLSTRHTRSLESTSYEIGTLFAGLLALTDRRGRCGGEWRGVSGGVWVGGKGSGVSAHRACLGLNGEKKLGMKCRREGTKEELSDESDSQDDHLGFLSLSQIDSTCGEIDRCDLCNTTLAAQANAGIRAFRCFTCELGVQCEECWMQEWNQRTHQWGQRIDAPVVMLSIARKCGGCEVELATPSSSLPLGTVLCRDHEGGPQLLCKLCFKREHRLHPLHRIYVWGRSGWCDSSLANEGLHYNLGSAVVVWGRSGWCDSSLANEGLHYNLGHAGRECLDPEDLTSLMVVADNGVHKIRVRYCGCGKYDEGAVFARPSQFCPKSRKRAMSRVCKRLERALVGVDYS
ncbi:hypothetical protein C8F04DRAFT_1195833 [Mycena alexandri]|uniref:CxC2-like cysteine cluster KDZ transposase-associated domain-containing protein n=1 Tax=Mycena alexandri TaxID=1745969 RepID=A0AAD6S560_9AGAR|nr:hypothetical protein C8F04DRAFT_1195833 [Mycena alexandri]